MSISNFKYEYQQLEIWVSATLNMNISNLNRVSATSEASERVDDVFQIS